MKSVYLKAAERFPKMWQEARARRRDRREQEVGSNALFTHEELIKDAPLHRTTRQGEQMTRQKLIRYDLPELDRADDPQGGAVGWALLAVGGALIFGVIVVVIWLTGGR